MQCKVTCFIIAVDCSDFGYVCFALLRMSLKVFADCLHERNSRIRLYGDDGFDYVEVQIDFTVKPFAAVALCAVPAIRSSYAEQAFFLETRLRLSRHFARRLSAPSSLSWQS